VRKQRSEEPAPGTLAPGSLRQYPWRRFLRGPDPELLETLYVPALGEAIRYDRCCAYFSSSVLSAAARGFGRLIARLETLGEQAPRPAIRLLVNEELAAEDVRALTETGDAARLEALLQKRFKNPADALEKQRLALLAWLVKQGLLEVRVGVMRRGEGPQDRGGPIEGALNTRTGELPVSVPERQFSRGAPTAGEASARLNSLARELARTAYPFAGTYAAEPKRVNSAAAPTVRRALVVPAGDYDVYVAVRERQRVGGRAHPKWAVVKRSLTVPDFSRAELTMSSVIFADRIDTLGGRLSAAQQAERPYALGGAEIVPATDAIYEPHEALSVVFFLYNVATDTTGSPDVTVQYQFSQVAASWKVFAETAPQRFSAADVPPIFDAKAGRQLVVTQAVPLKRFAPGDYEIEIVATDNVAGRSTRQRVSFRVGGGASSGPV